MVIFLYKGKKGKYSACKLYEETKKEDILNHYLFFKFGSRNFTLQNINMPQNNPYQSATSHDGKRHNIGRQIHIVLLHTHKKQV